MNRGSLLAGILLAALLTTTAELAADPAPAGPIVLEPAPQPRPRGLKGLFQRRPNRDRGVVIVAPAEPQGDAAPIDLVPPEAAAAAGEAVVAEETPATPKPAPVLNRKVPPDQVPLPPANPRRMIAEAVAPEAVATGTPEAADAEAPVAVAEAAATVDDPAPGEIVEAVETTMEAVAAEPEAVASMASPASDAAEPAESPVESPRRIEITAGTVDAPPPAPAEAGESDTTGSEPPVETMLPAGQEPVATVDTIVAETVAPAPTLDESLPAPQPVPEAVAAGESLDAGLTLDQRMEAERLVAAAQGDVSPRVMVDILQDIQDRIAQGSVAALGAQRRLRARIDDSFSRADPATWQEPANALAAVTYVLSGGAPDVLRTFATLDPAPAIDPRLAQGALAYVEGRQGEAAGLLMDIDVEALPARIGGQVALAQAALTVGPEPRKALVHLDMARLISPGTLVEEGAIRRSLFIADQIRDERRFESLSRQYLQRFRNSIYAGNFRYRFAAGLTHLRLLSDPAEFYRLDRLLAELEPDARGALFLTVASAAAVEGKFLPAALAAARARDLSEPGTPERARARLYSAAALVGVPGALDMAILELGMVQDTLLDGADRTLLQAVAETIAAIEAGGDVDALAATKPDPNAPVEEHPLVTRAEALRDEIDLLLEDAS